MMDDHGFKYATTRVEPGLAEAFYIEMWYFDLHDASAGVEFFVQGCINNPSNGLLGRLMGFPRSSDVFLGIASKEQDIRRITLDEYFRKFHVEEKGFYLSIGDDTMVFEATSEDTIRARGTDPRSGVSFDLVYKKLLPDPGTYFTRMSDRSRDFFYYRPMMCRAKVDGTIIVDGREHSIDCHGYHDHYWGSTTVFSWQPWAVSRSDDFAIITHLSAGTRGTHGFVSAFHDGKWFNLGLPEVKVIETFHSDEMDYDYPARMELVSRNDDGYELEYVIEKGDTNAFCLDIGYGGIVSPGIVATNFRTSGELRKDSRVLKNFEGLDTSFQWYEGFDYLKLIPRPIQWIVDGLAKLSPGRKKNLKASGDRKTGEPTN